MHSKKVPVEVRGCVVAFVVGFVAGGLVDVVVAVSTFENDDGEGEDAVVVVGLGP